MCGIFGKLTFSNEPGNPDLLSAMAKRLEHRGPDDCGIYCAAHIGLGQTRLSIIDLSKSATAPLSNEDRTIWVVFNGEIYNFETLRSGLMKKGHIFRTGTDTEVIVHLYEEYGVNCLVHMRGMFAFVVWDSKEKLLFAARDRLGEKPFCYHRNGRGLVFGSEIKAITADPSISIEPNFLAIDRYLCFQYVPSPLTAFREIHRLPAGHYLICNSAGKFSVHQYWSPPYILKKNEADDAQISCELMEKLRESVQMRMIADVPLGAFLSGGIDSSAVVALMAESSSKPIKTFSIGFEESEWNELPYARLIAKRFATDHHELIVRADAADVLPKLVWQYNEPFADSSAIPTYYVSQMTREHVTVALSGDGGDESFSGYTRYGDLLAWHWADYLPSGVRRASLAASEFLDRLPHERHVARISRGLYMLGSDLSQRYALHMMYLKPQERRAVYTEHFRALASSEDSRSTANPSDFPWDRNIDSLDWMMRHDQAFYLPDCLMVKTDIASMANSLEVRCPFLDHEMIEFAASIASHRKRAQSAGKLILKTALKTKLPQEILSKPKSGFGIPLGQWLRQDLKNILQSTLLDDRAARRRLFDRSFVRHLIEEHIDGRRDWSNRLWALLFLELWFRQFID